jgi:hypothetical protein
MIIEYTTSVFAHGLLVTSSRPSTHAGVKLFISDGELYLAVAQSVCEDYHTVEECQANAAQPRSAILQYNRVSRIFTEMLSMTDSTNMRLRGFMIPDSLLSHRPYALRLDAGRAVSWEYFESFGQAFLVAASLSEGAIIYKFSFQTIDSLRGAVDVTSDASNRRIFALNGPSGSVTSMYLGASFDKTGAKRSDCSLACLSYSRKIESPLGAARSISWRSPVGQAPERLGVRGTGEWGEWGLDSLAVTSGTFRDEVMCLYLYQMRADLSTKDLLCDDVPSVILMNMVCAISAVCADDLQQKLVLWRKFAGLARCAVGSEMPVSNIYG